ncbi:GHMP family kinase ATP-binding protein [Marinisporobacter balticus]|uniref:Threonine kinase n=1 Tax=Marinisporobacter balticus TaxID=2018667 RepID=A0A4R2L612_9FIRM|nr:propanediol utilization protein [Marinisporobacter balticus]TCO79499.1 threonine kinase [Marinisporobacter balticus]
MKVKAICPASCGELLQGEIGEGEKLISYPIDLYTVVTLEESKDFVKYRGRKKAITAMYKTIEYFGLPRRIGDDFSIHISSRIPIAKGMASSTADIGATAIATAKLIEKKLSEDALARICTEIEPTDSTIFKKLTLFDHLNGRRIKSFDWQPNLDILVFESHKKLNTEVFRMQDHKLLRTKNKEKVEKAYQLFEESYVKKDFSLFGKAATMSALANQNILYKQKIEDMIELSLKFGCFGVNVAHSGTVVGIIFEKNKVDVKGLVAKFREKSVHQHYYKYYLTKMVQGGVRLIDEE